MPLVPNVEQHYGPRGGAPLVGAQVVLVLTVEKEQMDIVLMDIVLLIVVSVLNMVGLLIIFTLLLKNTAMENANGEMKIFWEMVVDVFRGRGRNLRFGRSSVARR